MPENPGAGAQPHCYRHASKEDYKRPCVEAHEQGQLLPNRLLTQAEPLRPLRFYRPTRPGIAKYEKKHKTCVHNNRGDLNLKWVVSEGNEDKYCRQKHNGDNNEHSQFFE